ncbi:carboxylate-amine ligase [Palleronia aestuarii]|uniref:Putative glutamate--cysteine ligase 2 n=1 Tax=Palleronia aestuarii TaxID=568105 RepID=A0A2W7NJU6_9RHOB|nr:carboxylate-amine ligase [Palleronia aestuarii]PZX18347.1 carboxylate-amine ligase [Palleronia aestuarii]
MSDTPFSIGIEEEYLLVDAETLELSEASEELMAACRDALGDQVSPEFLRCQIEIGTKVCADIAEARAELGHLRSTVTEIAGRYGLIPIATGCHPTADWTRLAHRDKERYNDLRRDLAAISQRMLICGMHVHVGLPEDDLRIDLMNQASYFLPHLLALSVSSPFWQGRDTGLASYRVGIFDNLPRTGLPPRFESWGAYRRSVETIISTGMIEDATKIWWDMRPSDTFPTLETRIFDASPRLAHVLSLAAATQCVMRMLSRLRERNLRWRIYDTFLVSENRWRAQRYGCEEGLIDFGRGTVSPMSQLVDELIDLVGEDAKALGCEAELAGLHDILAGGTSSERQRRVRREALEAGADEAEAMRAVIRHLAEEFVLPG